MRCVRYVRDFSVAREMGQHTRGVNEPGRLAILSPIVVPGKPGVKHRPIRDVAACALNGAEPPQAQGPRHAKPVRPAARRRQSPGASGPGRPDPAGRATKVSRTLIIAIA